MNPVVRIILIALVVIALGAGIGGRIEQAVSDVLHRVADTNSDTTAPVGYPSPVEYEGYPAPNPIPPVDWIPTEAPPPMTTPTPTQPPVCTWTGDSWYCTDVLPTPTPALRGEE